MSHENVEIVRRLKVVGEQALESGLTSVPTDLIAPDVEIDLSRRVFNPGDMTGAPDATGGRLRPQTAG